MDKKIDVGDQVPDLTIATDSGGKVNLAGNCPGLIPSNTRT